MNILKIGSKGDEVKKLQETLNKVGYTLICDGIFGKKTEEAVKHFQTRKGLENNGIVNERVWNELEVKGNDSCIISYAPMTNTELTETLKADYACLWEKCVIKSEALLEVDKIVNTINSNKYRYEKISKSLGGKIPWFFIAVIHNMECSLNFEKHLHNGDSLKYKTKNVPAGRPLGNPPFTFEQSAEDALKMKGFHQDSNWTIVDILYKLERYNGFGYRKFHFRVKSPYLWSKSNMYIKGKYVADGKWDENAISQQVGVAVLIKRLVEKGYAQI